MNMDSGFASLLASFLVFFGLPNKTNLPVALSSVVCYVGCIQMQNGEQFLEEVYMVRLKLWLFLAYVVSFVSLAASVGLLIQDALVESGPSAWTGTAGVFQCVFVLISGLIYWTSHSE